METRRIGSLTVSVVGLGCNNFGWRMSESETARTVDAALDAGITFFDTADSYGGTESERFLGNALNGRRERAVIATKFGNKIDEKRQGAKAAYVRQAVEDSLRRLGTDRIDLYQLHKPDPTTPIAETLGALTDLVREGKVREIGCSNFSVAQLRDAEAVWLQGGAKFVSLQNEYSLLHRAPEQDTLAECERLELAFLPFFPLASGLLSGKYRKGKLAPLDSRLAAGTGWTAGMLTDDKLEVVERLIHFAESRGHTILELAFSWLASNHSIASVIAGATSPTQVVTNANAAGWKLTEEKLNEIDDLLG